MNITGPGLLDASGLAGLRASIRSLVSDPDASVSVTVATPTGTTVDLAAGLDADHRAHHRHPHHRRARC